MATRIRGPRIAQSATFGRSTTLYLLKGKGVVLKITRKTKRIVVCCYVPVLWVARYENMALCTDPRGFQYHIDMILVCSF